MFRVGRCGEMFPRYSSRLAHLLKVKKEKGKKSLTPFAPPSPAIPSLVRNFKKALLSIADGRAASFFNTFLKIITPPPFLRAAEFRLQRYEEKPRYVEIFRENRRNSEKIRENQRKTRNHL